MQSNLTDERRFAHGTSSPADRQVPDKSNALRNYYLLINYRCAAYKHYDLTGNKFFSWFIYTNRHIKAVVNDAPVHIH